MEIKVSKGLASNELPSQIASTLTKLAAFHVMIPGTDNSLSIRGHQIECVRHWCCLVALSTVCSFQVQDNHAKGWPKAVPAIVES